MRIRFGAAAVCLVVVSAAAWFGAGKSDKKEPNKWNEAAPGVFRTPGLPAGYALIDGDHALLIDAPRPADGLTDRGVKTIDAVLLTHHHRDAVAAAGRFLSDKVPLRAPKASAAWLTRDEVTKYWKESLPLRNSNTAYFVVPEGLDGVDCSLADGQIIEWRGWTVRVVEAPGCSRDHVAYAASKGKDGPLYLFCGDALAAPGKLWAPYTTDWDHWTDAGLKPAYESLRKLADLKPDVLLPAHGDVVAKDAVAALKQTADAVEEVAFLKSFERYTKQRLKDAPTYVFLAKEQAESNGSKPWSKISEHLFLTGNTYVLVSKDEGQPFLVVDPWDPHSAKQIPKIKDDEKLGPLEVVLCSHAHFDHYDGVYTIVDRDKPAVWTLDRVAAPIAEPFLLRAPFLDARPVKVDKRPKDGESLTWREYKLTFHWLPGQTEFTTGIETTIDGKRCYFTADNVFHQDQFSGTGGWMGLNRSYPLPYAESAQKVLDSAPDWVLAEHGGAFEFNAEDFRRRVKWGQAADKAAAAICLSGSVRGDWDPHRVHVEPVSQKAKAGDQVKAMLVVGNPTERPVRYAVALDGRRGTADQTWELETKAGGSARREVAIKLPETLAAGRHVFVLRATVGDGPDESDAFLAVDVGE
jgi:glyoxylase-like metal-dependent hydrolase (beta-lactamase superfamily II)